jgi:DNA-binding transcriptional MerR regulator
VEEATLTIGEIARSVVRRLQMIDVAKRAGFSLDEAASLFAAGTDRAPAATQLRALAEQKLPEGAFAHTDLRT